MKKAVFLDRDGTIIRDMIYLNDPSKIEILPESYKAIQALNQHDYMVILATNQSGVARGLVQEENLKLINQIIIDDFKKQGAVIHDVYYCAASVESNHANRKPNPGMLLDAAKKYQLDLTKSWMVGDRMTDVEAGLRAGCRSILLQNEFTPPIDPSFAAPTIVVKDVLAAAQLILENQ